MVVNIAGLIAVIIFYVLILVVGILAGRKSKSTANNVDSEEVMVAGRNIGLFVGVFTMTATWVGGGYINGTAESVYSEGTGLVWVQAPFGYCLSLILGGLLFAKKMREAGYVTMLDPFQQKFGERIGGLLFIPALCGEIFWSAAILAALGSTLSVIIGLEQTISVIISACIAIAYTLFGGLYAVAYTDVVQLICILVGLVISTPFVMSNEHVLPITETGRISPGVGWLGHLDKGPAIGNYIDTGLMLTFGGIPWQRVLSCRTSVGAQLLSFVAAFGCFIMAIPPVLIGAASYGCDWDAVFNGTSLNGTGPPAASLILPMALQYLVPPAVSFIGLGAISAAVMSSADSSILSASSMFARNIYKLTIRRGASEREIVWVMRGSVLVFGVMATVMGILIKSIYGLWTLCSDLVYVILFPQLVCVVYVPFVNSYGALAGYITAICLRLLGGEKILNFPPAIKYPWYDEVEQTQNFPFKTMSMLIALAVEIAVSALFKMLFETGRLPSRVDRLNAVVNERELNLYIASTNGKFTAPNPNEPVGPDILRAADIVESPRHENGTKIELTGYNSKYGAVYSNTEADKLITPSPITKNNHAPQQ
ncbi:hypothetical protein EB796_012617 [Bugula neritina]|uniref:SLC5A7 n=1 Tax=Bugula neritina TaxID=10212 RepID=A0A7J7JSV5_BUGNE|nr:hypothetical protein EB796_012617 [Bugula neritina]